jgi:hypothetical protein
MSASYAWAGVPPDRKTFRGGDTMTPQAARYVIEALTSLTLGLIAGIALLDYFTRPRGPTSLHLREEPGETSAPAEDYRDRKAA